MLAWNRWTERGKEMKTFSVRFYKRLILVFLALLILIPMVFAVFFGIRSADLERQLAQGSGEKEPGSQNTAEVDPSRTPAVVPTGYETGLDAEPLSYQLLYPDLYSTADVPKLRTVEIDTAYLTFDSSLSSNTTRILDVLDEYGVKATFFVMGTTDPDALAVMKDIVDRGHTIGLLSYSGSYQQIYRYTVDAYLDDFKQIYDLVYETTGVKAEIFRFPGGSVNSYSSSIYQELIAEMLRRNFVFFDWTINGEKGKNAAEISETVLTRMADLDRGIIKFRDTLESGDTAVALHTIIEGLRDLGFSFQPLTVEVNPVVFSYESMS